METIPTIWQKVDRLMQAQNLDMPTLAAKSGITRQSLYNLKNKGSTNTRTLEKIAEALGVGSGYLLP